MAKHKIGAAVLLSAILIGNCAIISYNHKDDNKEEIEAHAVSETDAASYIPPTSFSTKQYIEYEVPSGDTSFKSYMDYRAITNTNSPQYKLQEEAYTDSDGLRIYGSMGYYMIALGSYYTDTVGDKFRITLDNGETFLAVVGDLKADCHTDGTNRYYPMQNGMKNVVEFIVDTSELDKTAKKMGDISSIKKFEGKVSKIEKILE